ncbi:MAG TPA: glycosyltransferase family 1 protein [Pseudonocardia sp.]
MTTGPTTGPTTRPAGPTTGWIDFNALALRPRGSGVQTYIRELLAALPAVCGARLTAQVQVDAVGELPAAVTGVPHPVAAGARRALAGLALRTGHADVHHGLDADLPLRTGAATVATIHDLSVFDTPYAHSRGRAAGERWLVGRAVRRADAVLAVSAFTAERVEALFGRSATVTPLAPRPDLAPAGEAELARVRAAYDLPPRCVLQLATIEPRKDVEGLAAACRALDVPLLLAGSVAPGCRVPPGARHLGYVPDADLPGLYGAATVVGYCSHYEGFGLPAVEALACGAVLLTTAVGGIPEACGDAAAVVAPGRVDLLTSALRALLHDRDHRAALRERSVARAGELTWTATAAATASAYRALGVPALVSAAPGAPAVAG